MRLPKLSHTEVVHAIYYTHQTEETALDRIIILSLPLFSSCTEVSLIVLAMLMCFQVQITNISYILIHLTMPRKNQFSKKIVIISPVH